MRKTLFSFPFLELERSEGSSWEHFENHCQWGSLLSPNWEALRSSWMTIMMMNNWDKNVRGEFVPFCAISWDLHTSRKKGKATSSLYLSLSTGWSLDVYVNAWNIKLWKEWKSEKKKKKSFQRIEANSKHRPKAL